MKKSAKKKLSISTKNRWKKNYKIMVASVRKGNATRGTSTSDSWKDPDIRSRRIAGLKAEWAKNYKRRKQSLKSKGFRHTKGMTLKEIYGAEKAAEISRKKSASLMGHKNPYKGMSLEEIYGTKRGKKMRNLIGNGIKGKTSRLKGRTYEQIYGVEKAAALREIRSVAIAEQKSTFTNTGPEKQVYKLLVRLGFRPQKQYRSAFNRVHAYDFAIPRLKLVIEVDGCRWHACPEHDKNQTYIRNKEFDIRNTWAAIRAGWRILRIWEHDIRIGEFAALYDTLGLPAPPKVVSACE